MQNENSNSKTCRKNHVYTGTYCKKCKANRERLRYAANAEAERERKRIEYRKDHPNAIPLVPKKATKKSMSVAIHPDAEEEECAHEVARLIERGGRKLYYCFSCDTWIDTSGNEGAEPEEHGDPNAGKALAPTQALNGVGAQKHRSKPTTQQPRSQKRDEAQMVLMQCQHTDPETGHRCQHTFRVWIQNQALVQFCPQIHRLQHKRDLNRERQKAWRQRKH